MRKGGEGERGGAGREKRRQEAKGGDEKDEEKKGVTPLNPSHLSYSPRPPSSIHALPISRPPPPAHSLPIVFLTPFFPFLPKGVSHLVIFVVTVNGHCAQLHLFNMAAASVNSRLGIMNQNDSLMAGFQNVWGHPIKCAIFQ